MSRQDTPKEMLASTVCPFPPPFSLTLPFLVVSVLLPTRQDETPNPTPDLSPTVAPAPPAWKPPVVFVPMRRSCSYGRDYWQGGRSSTHSTVDVPAWEWDLSDPFSPVS